MTPPLEHAKAARIFAGTNPLTVRRGRKCLER